MENNNIDHPLHYCHGGMECIDEMLTVFGGEAVKHFCLLNVWKYRKRALYKNGEEDLKKADWYMKKLVELEGNARMHNNGHPNACVKNLDNNVSCEVGLIGCKKCWDKPYIEGEF